MSAVRLPAIGDTVYVPDQTTGFARGTVTAIQNDFTNPSATAYQVKTARTKGSYHLMDLAETPERAVIHCAFKARQSLKPEPFTTTQVQYLERLFAPMYTLSASVPAEERPAKLIQTAASILNMLKGQ